MTAAYHADHSRISRSMLGVLKQSPKLFYEMFVAKTRQPSPPSEAMVLGTRFETLLLEPHVYRERYAVAPLYGPDGKRWDLRYKAHKAAWQEFEQSVAGKELVTVEEHNRLMLMCEAAERHSDLGPLVKIVEGQVQLRLDWNHPLTDTPCKSLLDKMATGNLVLDLKTARDPSPEAFRRSVVRYGYHVQDAFYSLAYQTVYGRPCRFLFGVVGSEPPHDVAVYELDEAAKETGRREADLLITEYEARRRNNDWQADWSKGIVRLDLPRWYSPTSNEVQDEPEPEYAA